MAVQIVPIGDRDAWLARRRRYLNASDIACVFGLHKYKTLAQLTAEMRGMDGLAPNPDSPLLRRGNALEDDAADEIKRLRPNWNIVHCESQYIDDIARIAATPDFIVTDPERSGLGSLQIKVVSQSIFRRDWPDETPPLGHLLQLATEMMLLQDCSWGAIGALVIGEFTFEGYIFPVERNRSAEVRLRTAAAEFWKAFDAGDIPVIDYERDGALIALMFPREQIGKVLDLTFDNQISELLERREILKATAKDVETRLKACETEIKAKLGDAQAAMVPGWRVSFKTQNRAAYQVEATSFRVLRATRLPSIVRNEREGFALIAEREKST